MVAWWNVEISLQTHEKKKIEISRPNVKERKKKKKKKKTPIFKNNIFFFLLVINRVVKYCTSNVFLQFSTSSDSNYSHMAYSAWPQYDDLLAWQEHDYWGILGSYVLGEVLVYYVVVYIGTTVCMYIPYTYTGLCRANVHTFFTYRRN